MLSSRDSHIGSIPALRSCGTRRGVSRPSPATRQIAYELETAQASYSQPSALGLAAETLSWAAVRSSDRPTRNRHRLTPPRLSLVLTVEIEFGNRRAEN